MPKRCKTVLVNDKMQRGYRYVLTAPIGRNFDPDFQPDLTPKQMLSLGVFCLQIPERLPQRIPGQLVHTRATVKIGTRLRAELFRDRCQSATVGLAQEGMDSPR